MKSILILSPHPDDAALSCTDHIISWKKKGYNITVCTIFSKLTSSVISNDARKFMIESGFHNQDLFEKARNQEDINALRYLRVKYITPKFIDAAFRSYKNILLYKNFHALFNQKISQHDIKLVNKLSNLFFFLGEKYDFIVVPMAIGNHIDHRITNYCAKISIKKNKILFYLDAPYYFSISNWEWKYLKEFLISGMTILMTTQLKRKVLNFYVSQKTIFNKNIMYYPEIITDIAKK